MRSTKGRDTLLSVSGGRRDRLSFGSIASILGYLGYDSEQFAVRIRLVFQVKRETNGNFDSKYIRSRPVYTTRYIYIYIYTLPCRINRREKENRRMRRDIFREGARIAALARNQIHIFVIPPSIFTKFSSISRSILKSRSRDIDRVRA